MANEFQYRGQLNGAENPVVLTVPIGNDETAIVGRAIKLDTNANGGGLTTPSAGDKLLGIVVGLVDQYGIDLVNTSESLGGTYTEDDHKYVAASDNMTVDKVAGRVIVDPYALWYNDSAGDLADVDILKYFDLTDASQVADQDGHDTAGALQLISIDEDDASVGIFRIVETQMDAYVQQ